ncbi:MAG: winged helix-turn-helix transcriptional regulator [Thermoplasmatota archaeon]
MGDGDSCTLTDLFRLLGERHVPDVIHRVLQEESVRFNAIQDDLGMSPNTLSDRLKKLQAAGLVTRHAYQEIPPRVEYRATQKARELDKVFDILGDWAGKHTLTPDPA